MPDVHEEPVVGQPYQGKAIVTEIIEEVKEWGNGTKSCKRITMDDGVIYSLDHFVESGKSKTGSAGSGSGEAGRNSPKKNHAGSLDRTKRAYNTTRATNPTAAVEASPKKAVVTDEDNDQEGTDHIGGTSDSNTSVPLSMLVYSKDDPDLPSASHEGIRGIWTYDEGTTPGTGDSELWKPQEIFLFKPGEDLDTIIEEDSSLPTGVWGYPDGKEPSLTDDGTTSGASNMGSELDEVDKSWHPSIEAWVVPPMVEIPANFVTAGWYTYKPGSVNRWPPPLDHIKEQLRNVGKLNIPTCFKNGKLPIKVFPKSKVPDPNSPPAKKGVSFAPVGQWSYPEGEEEVDDHFVPVDVDLYLGQKMPAGSEDGSLAGSWGFWGSSQGSLDLDDPEWEPEMSMVFPPGAIPDPEIAIQGRWAYPLNQNVKIEWPPVVTQTATVYPRKDAPDIEKGKSQGIWDFKMDSDPADEEDWEPQEVNLLGEGEDDSVDDNRPNGIWAIKRGAEPDRDWNWQPKDVVFYAPNEAPGDDSWVQGKWAMPGGKLKNTWPPKSGKPIKPRTAGKLKIPECFEGGQSIPIVVFPRNHVAKANAKVTPSGNGIGKWAYPKNDEKKDDNLFPQEVLLHFGDDKPPAATEEGSLPDYGVWALPEDDPKNSAEKMYDSNWTPRNTLVFPPGVQADPGVQVQGKWSVPGRLSIDWPPNKSKRAWVYPANSLPAATTKGRTEGVWKFRGASPENSTRWKPQEVDLYGPSDPMDDTTPSGSWGLKEGAELDNDLNFELKDVWFYPPGEEPAPECKVQGKWAFLRGKLEVLWPPNMVSPAQAKQLSVGKLKIPGAFENEAGGGDKANGSVGKLKVPSLFSNS